MWASRRAGAAPTGARPSPRGPGCRGARGPRPCPLCTPTGTATAARPSPTECGRTGRPPQVHTHTHTHTHTRTRRNTQGPDEQPVHLLYVSCLSDPSPLTYHHPHCIIQPAAPVRGGTPPHLRLADGVVSHRCTLSVSSPPGPTPFPCNPLTMTMRFPGGMVSSPSQAGGQRQAWGDEEPKPLLCSQYETLSDTE